MLATITTKTIRDRWLSVAIGAGTMALLLIGGMAIYRDLDLSIYTGLPEAFRSLIGITADTDVGGLAYGAIYSSYGVLVIAGLAISLGSGSFAREEANGTMGLLLGNPKSRTDVVVSKAIALIVLMASASAVLWLGGLIAPSILDVNVGSLDVGALIIHMFVHALFYGFMALSIGAWTGKPGLASGVTGGFMVVSFIAVGLLPLVEGLESGVNGIPWYYFSGGEPLLNGVNWGDLAVLAAGIVVLGAISLIGANRRDLRGKNGGVTLLDRLRTNPATQKVFDRLAGSARVSRMWIKTASDHQVLLIVVGYVLILSSIAIGPMYNAISESLASFSDLPEAVLAVVGGGDISTPEGWYQIETFGLLVPIGVMVVTITIGGRALAGEEANRTMGLLLANPISRASIVREKAIAMIVMGVAVGLAAFVGVAIGSAIAGLGMNMANIAATSLLATLLGLAYGALALALSALAGKLRLAIFGAAGVAAVFHIANAFLAINERTAGFAEWTPNHYYLGDDPLINGMSWGNAGVLSLLTAILLAGSVVLFERRDLRNQG